MWKKGRWDYRSNGLDDTGYGRDQDISNPARKSGRARTVTERARDAAESGEFSRLDAVFKTMGANGQKGSATEPNGSIRSGAPLQADPASASHHARSTSVESASGHRPVQDSSSNLRSGSIVSLQNTARAAQKNLSQVDSIRTLNIASFGENSVASSKNNTRHAGGQSNRLKFKMTPSHLIRGSKDTTDLNSAPAPSENKFGSAHNSVTASASSATKHVRLAPKITSRSSPAQAIVPNLVEDQSVASKANFKYVQPSHGRRPRNIVTTLPDTRRRPPKYHSTEVEPAAVINPVLTPTVASKARGKDRMDAFNEALRKALAVDLEATKPAEELQVNPAVTIQMLKESESPITISSSPEHAQRSSHESTDNLAVLYNIESEYSSDNDDFGSPNITKPIGTDFGSVAQLFKQQAQLPAELPKPNSGYLRTSSHTEASRSLATQEASVVDLDNDHEQRSIPQTLEPRGFSPDSSAPEEPMMQASHPTPREQHNEIQALGNSRNRTSSTKSVRNSVRDVTVPKTAGRGLQKRRSYASTGHAHDKMPSLSNQAESFGKDSPSHVFDRERIVFVANTRPSETRAGGQILKLGRETRTDFADYESKDLGLATDVASFRVTSGRGAILEVREGSGLPFSAGATLIESAILPGLNAVVPSSLNLEADGALQRNSSIFRSDVQENFWDEHRESDRSFNKSNPQSDFWNVEDEARSRIPHRFADKSTISDLRGPKEVNSNAEPGFSVLESLADSANGTTQNPRSGIADQAPQKGKLQDTSRSSVRQSTYVVGNHVTTDVQPLSEFPDMFQLHYRPPLTFNTVSSDIDNEQSQEDQTVHIDALLPAVSPAMRNKIYDVQPPPILSPMKHRALAPKRPAIDTVLKSCNLACLSTTTRLIAVHKSQQALFERGTDMYASTELLRNSQWSDLLNLELQKYCKCFELGIANRDFQAAETRRQMLVRNREEVIEVIDSDDDKPARSARTRIRKRPLTAPELGGPAPSTRQDIERDDKARSRRSNGPLRPSGLSQSFTNEEDGGTVTNRIRIHAPRVINLVATETQLSEDLPAVEHREVITPSLARKQVQKRKRSSITSHDQIMDFDVAPQPKKPKYQYRKMRFQQHTLSNGDKQGSEPEDESVVDITINDCDPELEPNIRSPRQRRLPIRGVFPEAEEAPQLQVRSSDRDIVRSKPIPVAVTPQSSMPLFGVLKDESHLAHLSEQKKRSLEIARAAIAKKRKESLIVNVMEKVDLEYSPLQGLSDEVELELDELKEHLYEWEYQKIRTLNKNLEKVRSKVTVAELRDMVLVAAETDEAADVRRPSQIEIRTGAPGEKRKGNSRAKESSSLTVTDRMQPATLPRARGISAKNKRAQEPISPSVFQQAQPATLPKSRSYSDLRSRPDSLSLAAGRESKHKSVTIVQDSSDEEEIQVVPRRITTLKVRSPVETEVAVEPSESASDWHESVLDEDESPRSGRQARLPVSAVPNVTPQSGAGRGKRPKTNTDTPKLVIKTAPRSLSAKSIRFETPLTEADPSVADEGIAAGPSDGSGRRRKRESLIPEGPKTRMVGKPARNPSKPVKGWAYFTEGEVKAANYFEPKIYEDRRRRTRG